jgi:serine/threonine protein kinase
MISSLPMLRTGARVGDYEIEKRLGAGAMAYVYKVRDKVLGGEFALKVLDETLRKSAEARRRFLDEARVQAALGEHPGIVRALGAVSTPEIAALVSAFVEGPTLAKEIERRRELPDADQIRTLMVPVVQAVGAAHARGVVHRGLKPANVLLVRTADGQTIPKVTDFGITKIIDRGSDKAPSGKSSIRSPARKRMHGYLSPEQVRSVLIATAGSDIYALGVLIYECATGLAPFTAENEEKLAKKILKGIHLRLHEARPDLPSALCDVVERAMALVPEERFKTCDELATALAPPRRRLRWRS